MKGPVDTGPDSEVSTMSKEGTLGVDGESEVGDVRGSGGPPGKVVEGMRAVGGGVGGRTLETTGATTGTSGQKELDRGRTGVRSFPGTVTGHRRSSLEDHMYTFKRSAEKKKCIKLNEQKIK